MQLRAGAIGGTVVSRFHTLTVTDCARVMRAFRFPQNPLTVRATLAFRHDYVAMFRVGVEIHHTDTAQKFWYLFRVLMQFAHSFDPGCDKQQENSLTWISHNTNKTHYLRL